MNRRDFLKASQVGLLAAGVGAGPLVVARRAFAAPPPPPPPTPLKKPVLVAIFLRGGMDQLNVIVPHGDKNYYDLRPSIAIPKAVPEGGDEGDAVIALDKQWGLHPAMQPLRPFYKSGRFAAVVNAGSPHGTRSHFDAQDFMEYAAPGLRTVRDGWLNRYLQLSRAKNGKEAELRALAMQNLLPRSLRGSYAVAAVPRTIEAAPEPEKPAAGAGRMRGNDRQALRNPLAIFDDFYGATAAEVDTATLIDDLLAEGKPAAKKAPAAAETPEMSSERTDPVFQTGRETVVKLRDVQAILNRPDLASAAQYPSGANRGRYAFAEALADIAKVIKADVGL
ncbi:MAG: DUF1501 domain-containing protein, partial [Planctomycetes bacterium]|nr:DUF1501 domain-containing protein [Planctomycetota bacterium]